LDAEEAAGEFLDDGSSYFDTVFFAHCPPVWEICTAFLQGSLTRNPHGEGAWEVGWAPEVRQPVKTVVIVQ
jgi:hypothetical protein